MEEESSEEEEEEEEVKKKDEEAAEKGRGVGVSRADPPGRRALPSPG